MRTKDIALTLHHVGYATRQIEPAVQTYIDRFGYIVETAIIHDPLQTAFVQFLKLPDDRTYLEFVAPDGPGSKLSSAIKPGGVLNHLCYTCPSLEPVIAHLEDQRMKLISEPKPGIAFAGRRICWLLGENPLPIELVERLNDDDLCLPGL